MDGYAISEVAARTGFPPSTLRFYEQHGLVRPGRTAAGYRSYDDADLAALAFIGRAKRFGLTLDEITELLGLLAGDECAPVQDRMRALVDDKVADAQARIAELIAFTGELRRVGAALEHHTPDGPCDDGCGCTTDGPLGTVAPVELLPRRDLTASPPIACSLEPGAVRERIEDWQRTLDGATACEDVETGVRVTFDAAEDLGALVELAAAEQRCCAFLSFALTVDGRGVALEITGPPDARPVIDALVASA